MKSMHLAGALAFAALFCGACHPGPVVSTRPTEINAGGTIAGFVRATGGAAPLPTRHVIATNVKTGAKFDTTTGVNGGYTIKVPETGTYRIEVETRDGEVIAKGPEQTEINNGDLDAGRDFENTVKGQSSIFGNPQAIPA